MYSEKLKKLIEAKTPLKFRIKDEQQFKEIQDFFFTLGYGWLATEKSILRHPHKFVFFNEINNVFCLSISDDLDDWVLSPLQEFDLEKDCLVEEKEQNENIFQNKSISMIKCCDCKSPDGQTLLLNEFIANKVIVYICNNEECEMFNIFQYIDKF